MRRRKRNCSAWWRPNSKRRSSQHRCGDRDQGEGKGGCTGLGHPRSSLYASGVVRPPDNPAPPGSSHVTPTAGDQWCSGALNDARRGEKRRCKAEKEGLDDARSREPGLSVSPLGSHSDVGSSASAIYRPRVLRRDTHPLWGLASQSPFATLDYEDQIR